MRHRTRHEREQLELFRALPGDLAPRDAQDLMAYPFFSLAKTHRTTPIDFRMKEIAIRVEAVPEHGMATIWDADVLIWAASQIVEARDAGLRTSRRLTQNQRTGGSVGCKLEGDLRIHGAIEEAGTRGLLLNSAANSFAQDRLCPQQMVVQQLVEGLRPLLRKENPRAL